MNIYKNLILIKSKKTNKLEDKTADISYINYVGNQVEITFLKSDKTYNYNSSNVRVFREPNKVNLSQGIVLVSGFPIRSSSIVLDFGEYIKVIDGNNVTEVYHKSVVTYQKSCLNSEQPKAVFDYFKKLSSYVSVTEDGRMVLRNQYDKIITIRDDSVLATYLLGSNIKKSNNKFTPIFPFGVNLSQEKAVKCALENSISVIEGPPGTGKTQTILNIISNIVSKGETVGVVSGNNSATSNVQEKLVKNGYGFITALLGNADKKKDFFENNKSNVPEMASWAVEAEQMQKLSEQLRNISKELDELLQVQNKIARLKENLSKLEIEQSYFENTFKDLYESILKFSFYKNWSTDLILDFIIYFEDIVLKDRNGKLPVKAFLFIKYGIYKFKYVNENQTIIVVSLKRDYYNKAIDEIKSEIFSMERKLENKNYKKLMEEYTKISATLFKAKLFKKYSKRARGNYTIKSFKYNFKNFIEDYPVILSTTHSIMTSISENYLFDYIIIDEASQVDLVTASLALACCKNVVIVGDVKQLPQIVVPEIKKISDKIFYESNIGEAYDFSKYSIIASLIKLYKDGLPRTLLSEHYRCHPKIIGFCNEKFYNNELVIMTEEKPNDIPLKIYKTVPGNHARRDNFDKEKGWFNLRQIEVIKDEVIDQNKDSREIGIICPYRRQVTEVNGYLGKSEIEVDTVHKFQGREKHTIIFTTVVNSINSFVDDANLINVAVSRAVKELIIITSSKLFKQHGTNIGDLIRYIEYNSLSEAIIESQKVSVFDLLYSEYSDKLIKVMESSKNISEHKSEVLMYRIIEEVLEIPKFSSFKCAIHVPLNSIIKNINSLSDEEKSFVQNPWTHVDFLIYNKLDKEPSLVVEVDGYAFHANNEKQKHRDNMKDKILNGVNIPILRIATNESGEKERLINMLDGVINDSEDVY